MLGKNLLLTDVMPSLASDPTFVTSTWNPHVDTLVMSGVCMLFILGAGSMIANSMVAEGAGGKGQAVVEGFYNFLSEDLAHQNIGPHWKTFFPLVAAIFTFVLMGNFIGVFPYHALEHQSWWPIMHLANGESEPWEWAAPTTDFMVTCGLAAVALITYLWSGFWKHGAHFTKIFFFSPMSWVEWLDFIIRPSTLALRLMVVITADELMRAAFLVLCPFIVPTGIMAFEMFIGVIQALVFALLTSVYIGLTVAEHH